MTNQPSSHDSSSTGEGHPLRRWQLALLSAAILATVGGLMLKAQRADEYERQSAVAATRTPEGPSVRVRKGSGLKGGTPLGVRPGEGSVPAGDDSFRLPGMINGPSESENGEAVGSEPGLGSQDDFASWSPLLIKGGFSFALAFALGYALRSFLRFALLVAGTIGLAIFALSYWGGVDLTPAMARASELWDGFAGQIQAEASSFKAFMTGNLPSAGSASLGLFAGFKKG